MVWQAGAAESGGALHRQQREAIVRNPVRKFVGVAVMGVLAALFALPMVGAGAQTFVPGEGPPPSPECNITSFQPSAPVATFPTTVTVQGTVVQDAIITMFAQTPPGSPAVQIAQVTVTPGPFSVSAQVSGPSAITFGVTYGPDNAYAAACAGVGGVTTFNVEAEQVVRPTTPAAAAAQLAFTGSSDTPSYVLIGIAAIVIGAVLVIAARRRSHLS
jgi:LPXTG-motif cell wall-anchored protein